MNALEKLRAVKDRADKQKQRVVQSNRALMPKVTKVVDAVRAEFGDVKVTYASENGVTLGKSWADEQRKDAA